MTRYSKSQQLKLKNDGVISTNQNRGVDIKTPLDRKRQKLYFMMGMYIHIDLNTLFLARNMKVDIVELNNNKKVKCSDEDYVRNNGEQQGKVPHVFSHSLHNDS